MLTGDSYSSCSRTPMGADGRWLVYADVLENGRREISQCGLSRKLSFPYARHTEIPVPEQRMPTLDQIIDDLNAEISGAESLHKALLILKKEIEQLRKWK